MAPHAPARRLVTLLAALALFAARAAPALAEEAPAAATTPRPSSADPGAPTVATAAAATDVPRRHVVGFGLASALGAAGYSGTRNYLAWYVADLHFDVPVSSNVELVLVLPVGRVVRSAVDGYALASLGFQGKFFPMAEGEGLFLAPGLRLSYNRALARDGNSFNAELPVRVGYEFPLANRLLGIALSGRPFVGLSSGWGSSGASGYSSFSFGAGIFAEAELTLYVTRPSR